jgi:hypothetical protein
MQDERIRFRDELGTQFGAASNVDVTLGERAQLEEAHPSLMHGWNSRLQLSTSTSSWLRILSSLKLRASSFTWRDQVISAGYALFTTIFANILIQQVLRNIQINGVALLQV